jgi:hypothetical protein
MTSITVTLSVRNVLMRNESAYNEAAENLGALFNKEDILVLHHNDCAIIFHDCALFLKAQREREHKGESRLIQKPMRVFCLKLDADSNNLVKCSQKIVDCVGVNKCHCSIEKNFQSFWKELIR